MRRATLREERGSDGSASEYDADGNLIYIKTCRYDPDGYFYEVETATYTYDSNGNLIRAEGGRSSTSSESRSDYIHIYTYDAGGNLIRKQVDTYGYDETSIFPDTFSSVTTYTYDCWE